MNSYVRVNLVIILQFLKLSLTVSRKHKAVFWDNNILKTLRSQYGNFGNTSPAFLSIKTRRQNHSIFFDGIGWL